MSGFNSSQIRVIGPTMGVKLSKNTLQKGSFEKTTCLRFKDSYRFPANKLPANKFPSSMQQINPRPTEDTIGLQE
jgi:hypothetical protein